jgi:hypothetical protein
MIVRSDCGEEISDLRIRRGPVQISFENRELFASFVDPRGRHIGFLVPSEKRGRVLEQIDLPRDFLQA